MEHRRKVTGEPRTAPEPEAPEPRAAEEPKAAQPRTAVELKTARPRTVVEPNAAKPRAVAKPRTAKPRTATEPKAALSRAVAEPKAAQPRTAQRPVTAEPRTAASAISLTEPPAAPVPVGPPVSELELTGCKPVPMTYRQLRRYEGRLELWDAATETAWMVREPTSADHESPSHGLAGLVERVAAVRGSPIACYGSMDLLVRDAQGEPRRIMQADQTVYLRPSRAEFSGGGALVVGQGRYPDMVLEVDHTTDIRRGKLVLYEAWGFPELWVEVPDHRAPSRPKSRPPGLTIHRLEDGAYRESSYSGAFPGWRVEEIHDALNEIGRSARTNAILERLGNKLGAREGTGPDDDSLLRSLRDRSRAEGLAKGRAEMARQMLLSRGIEVSEGFPAGAPAFAGLSEAAIVAAALACDDERDFDARVAGTRGR